MQAFLGDITALCRLAAREGSLPRIAPPLLAMALMGTVNTFVTQWATQRRGSLAEYQEGAHAILHALTRHRGTARAVTSIRRTRA
jgi:hypothetical protein